MEFIRQIQNDRHSEAFGCSFKNSEFQREVRKGFQSILVFKCSMCNEETRLNTDLRGPDELGVNDAMVLGAVAGGGGFANVDEIAAAADMPCMSQPTYIAHEAKVGAMFEQAALESMQKAGAEEKRLALENNDLAPDGTPRIRVIADGMWSKRSYGNKYDAKSGTASIVGFRTRKVLYYGTRNKHCYVCVLDANQNKPKRDHECSKNFTGHSGQMEAAIILEGFKASVEMHGVKYYQLVGDRDSSVYNTLLEKPPYGSLELVEKIDCKNHLLRNYRSWTIELHGNTKLPLPDHVDPRDQRAVTAMKKEMLALRCHIRDNVKRLSNGIAKASTYRGAEKGNGNFGLVKGRRGCSRQLITSVFFFADRLDVRIQRLQQDILNVAAHPKPARPRPPLQHQQPLPKPRPPLRHQQPFPKPRPRSQRRKTWCPGCRRQACGAS
ncbi:uncharacterized protein LOC117640414 [Thrips palmi]|uniref:Uncharacterized protein LOC117640414 n=1 Tax=Thrips palmi TaxID=161013 RepID=A0A6P8Y846_THRPL|nr:uncharacterized protein LOC117640414 [Thrips palmi]